VVCLLAALPLFVITVGSMHADNEHAPIFCILWVLGLTRHAPAMGTLARVISNERATLTSVAVIFVMVLIVSATAVHLLERGTQPKLFGNLPDALWWAVVTLTTTGYGDAVPLTVGARMVGSVVMVSGILVLALMTGILATGFAEEERRREYLRVWDQVTKVPMFAELGTVTLSEIVGKLRVRHYPPRIVVLRRDEPGDSMFFISDGEVEVRLPRGGIILGQGAFFGEMALLDRLPRSATVVTTRPSTLLVLYASDFYEIASNIPALVEAVEREARRRHAENQSDGAFRNDPPDRH
jgi:voltage-gated potassium channel